MMPWLNKAFSRAYVGLSLEEPMTKQYADDFNLIDTKDSNYR
jgi:hypothetical protein